MFTVGTQTTKIVIISYFQCWNPNNKQPQIEKLKLKIHIRRVYTKIHYIIITITLPAKEWQRDTYLMYIKKKMNNC